MTPLGIVLWVSLALIVYTYAGFPLLLWIVTRFHEKPIRRRPHEPRVTMLIPAYNEAEWIEAKIRNTLALDYPKDKLEILIASDGSRDETVEIAKRFADGKTVRVLDFKTNSGKLALLNKSVPEANGEIVFFSDASAMLSTNAVRLMMETFADPDVGGVCGRYRVLKAEEADIGRQEDLYWRYETAIKEMESRIHSIIGGHGQIHAVRKHLYSAPPPDTINDDFVIPARVLAQGYRVVYEPRALANEEAREMSGFKRRIRIMAGNIQQLSELPALLSPPRWIPLFFFLSHKAGRVLVPFAMVAALIANLALLSAGPIYQILALLQLGFYLLTALGAVLKLKPKVLLLPYYFCMVNAAMFAGLYHALRRRRKMAWK